MIINDTDYSWCSDLFDVFNRQSFDKREEHDDVIINDTDYSWCSDFFDVFNRQSFDKREEHYDVIINDTDYSWCSDLSIANVGSDYPYTKYRCE